MDATNPIDLSRIARRFKLTSAQVEAAIGLLDSGNTPAFIARYRKDQTDGLDEPQVRALRGELRRGQQLAHRKEAVKRTVQAQSKLTDELTARIDKARDLRQVEDLFLPFQAHKEALAATARERGLTPLAEEVLTGSVSSENLETRAADFVDADRKLTSVADVLLGVGHILAEDLSDNATLRGALRKIYRDQGRLISTRIEAPAADTPAAEAPAAKKESPQPAEEKAATEEAAETDATAETAEATPSAAAESTGAEPPVDDTAAFSETEAKESSDAAVEEVATEDAAPKEETAKEEAAQAEGDSTVEAKATEADNAAAKTADANKPDGDNAPKAKPKAKKRTGKSKAKKKQAEKKAKQFSEFFDFKQPLTKLKPHQILTINRGEKSGVLKIAIDVDGNAIYKAAEEAVVEATHPHADFLRGCLRDALARILPASLEQDVRRDLTDKAEEHALDVFASNLRNLLLQPPVANKRVLAIDPNFKSGCKLAAIDADGVLLGEGVLHIVGNKERLAESRTKLVELVRHHTIDVIAIGNGTASRETEQIVAELFEGDLSPEVEADKLAYLIVNKAGAADYSTSQIGREEFPETDAAVRAAIFIGRRLLDPLAELVKVDPASIGVGLFQHDIQGTDLSATLSEVVESCVNHVGVDLNRATASLLRYVSGLNPLIARRLFEHRQEHGPFTSRQQLHDVTGFSEESFTQAAGFLRIPDAANPLDASWIHPDNYELSHQVRDRLERESSDTATNGRPDAAALAEQLGVGTRLVRDIVVQLKQPGRDPREDLPKPIFRKRAMKIEDLTVGQDLRATVLNVTDFGAFIDIGLKDSALVHVSKISANYVSDPHKIVAVGDTVQVWITAIDTDKGRVTLTMIHPGGQPSQRGGRPRRRPQGGDTGAGRGKPARGKSGRDGQRSRGQRSRSGGGGGPKTSTPRRERKPKPVVPITNEMLKGDEPMRTFGDLKQFIDSQSDDDKGDAKASK